jgi:hypothetical protein
MFVNNQQNTPFGSIEQFKQQYNQLSANLSQNGISPEAYVNQLINSGQMTQEQFIQFSRMADQILGRK